MIKGVRLDHMDLSLAHDQRSAPTPHGSSFSTWAKECTYTTWISLQHMIKGVPLYHMDLPLAHDARSAPIPHGFLFRHMTKGVSLYHMGLSFAHDQRSALFTTWISLLHMIKGVPLYHMDLPLEHDQRSVPIPHGSPFNTWSKRGPYTTRVSLQHMTKECPYTTWISLLHMIKRVAMSNQRSFKIESFRFAAFVPKKIEYIRFWNKILDRNKTFLFSTRISLSKSFCSGPFPKFFIEKLHNFQTKSNCFASSLNFWAKRETLCWQKKFFGTK
jgi:hypothetical protein